MTTDPQPTTADEDVEPVDGAQNDWDVLEAEAIAACVAAEEADEEDDLDLEADSSAMPDSIRQYLNEISRHPLLTKADEVRLAKLKDLYLPYRLTEAESRGLTAEERDLAYWEKIKHLSLAERQTINEGKRAFDTLVESNLRLVVSQAKRYTHLAQKMSLLDLCQEANIGLMRAVELFDHRKGFKFSTYASWWIRQSITRVIANDGRTIRLPVHLLEANRKLHAVRARYVAQHNAEPSDDELARLLKITLADLDELQRLPEDAKSLNQKLKSDDEAEVGDLLEDESAEVVEELADAQLAEAVQEALRRLPALQRKVMSLRWGISADGGFDEEPRTLEQVGAYLGTTRERAREAELEALARLQRDRKLKGFLGLPEIGAATPEVDESLETARPDGVPQVNSRIWTDETLEAELRRFVGRRRSWPTKQEFLSAGRGKLHAAVAAHGGQNYWARRLGVKPISQRRGRRDLEPVAAADVA